MFRFRDSPKIVIVLLLAATSAVAGEAPAAIQPGVELFVAGDLGRAFEFFSNLERASEGAWIDYYLGRIELQRGRTRNAIARFEAASQADPTRPLFLRWRGEAYVQRIDEVGVVEKVSLARKARSSFGRAVELSPSDFESRRSLAGYFLNAPAVVGGSREKADQQARELLALDPAKGRLLKGRIHAIEAEWAAAVEEYQAAIELGQATVQAYVWLGEALVRLGRPQAATDAYAGALTVLTGVRSGESSLTARPRRSRIAPDPT